MRVDTKAGQQPRLGSKPTEAGEKEMPTRAGAVGEKGVSNQRGRGRGDGRFTQDGRYRPQRPSGDAPPTQSSQDGGGRNQISRNEKDDIGVDRPATLSAQGQKHVPGEHGHRYQTQGTRSGETDHHAQSHHNQRVGVHSGRDEHTPHSRNYQQRSDRGLPSAQGHQTQRDRSYGGAPLTQRTQPERNKKTWDGQRSQNRGKAGSDAPSMRERQQLWGHDSPRQWEQQGSGRGGQGTGPSGRTECSHLPTGGSGSQPVSNNTKTEHRQPSRDGGTQKSQGTTTADAINTPHKGAHGNTTAIPSSSYYNRRRQNPPPEYESPRAGRSSMKAHSSCPSAPTDGTSTALASSKPGRNVPYTATQVKKT